MQEPRDFIAATLLFIHIVGPYVRQAVVVAGGIKATRDLAQILYPYFQGDINSGTKMYARI